MQPRAIRNNIRSTHSPAISRSGPFAFRVLGLTALALLLLCVPLAAADSYWNAISGDWSATENWNGGLPTSSSNAYVVNGGTATVTLSGQTCGNLTVGNDAGSGAVEMTGGSLSASASGAVEYLGYSGTGDFMQSGGTHQLYSNGSLYLGYNTGAVGTYTLSGSGVLLAPSEYVGYSGTGSFTQTGGTAGSSSHFLALGYNAGAMGSYNLSGGQLSDRIVYVGYSGAGTFTHSGGSNVVVNRPGNSYYLYLGYNAGSSGTYNLSGSGQLSSEREYVGYNSAAAALFQQTGGSNATAYLSIGSGGRYVLTGGTLNITGNGGIINQGVLDCRNGQATVSVGSNCIVDFSRADLTNVAAMHVSVDANSLLILPAGFNPSTEFGSFTHGPASIVHSAGTTLVVPAGQAIGGQGSIGDWIDCQGTISTDGGSIHLNNGLLLSGVGEVNLGHGTLTVNDGASGITGGKLWGNPTVYIGRGGTGVFTQSGGNLSTNTGSLYLGYDPADTGTYRLSSSGSLSVAGITYVGHSGTGVVTQSGGTSKLRGLYLGYDLSSSGSYELSGTGQLSSGGNEYVGYNGSGTLLQSGGNHSVTSSSSLILGQNAGSNGSYVLGGAGSVTAFGMVVGAAGAGTFTQYDGTVSVSSSLRLGSGAGGSGTYHLVGGQLSAPNERIGENPDAAALFHQTGGSNAVTSTLSIGPGGRYELHGGTLQLDGSIVNSGVFDGGSSPSTLIANCVVDLSVGAWQNLASTTFRMGSNSLLIVPAEFNPSAELAGDSTLGLIHTVGTTFILPAGQGFTGSGTIGDPVDCQGTIDAGTDGTISLTGGLTVSGNGTLRLGDGSSSSKGHGSVITNDTFSAMSGGSLDAEYHYVGNGGTGLFTQLDGTNTSSYLDVAHNAGDSGEYRLNGGRLDPSFVYAGYAGRGVFAQSGGTSLPSFLYVGREALSQGTYTLSGSGELYAWKQSVGDSGSGRFVQSGGTNTITGGNGDLYLGYQLGSTGTYELSEAGVLSVNGHVYVGYRGDGAFIQTGGTHTIIWPVGWSGSQMADLFVGYTTGSSGSYFLASGLLSMTSKTVQYVGYQGTGEFTHTGGTNALAASSYLEIGCYTGSSGTYHLSGSGVLTAPLEIVGYNTLGIFNQSGGTNSVATLTLASSAGASGTYNLDGGLLEVAALGAGAGTATFNFGGGILRASGPLSTSLPMTLTGNEGDATIDTAGNAVTLTGELSGPGGLTKLGDNILTLTGANTYTGPTTIEAGILSIGNPYLDDLAGVSIAAGARLDLAFSGIDTVGTLYLDGVRALAGTWGTTGSGAAHMDDVHFSGTGQLNVVPEPSTFVLLGMGAVGLLAFAWRRGKWAVLAMPAAKALLLPWSKGS